MKKYVIDTNALISFVTDRDPNQQQKIAEVFNGAGRLMGIVVCPQNVLTEFVYVMDSVYHVSKNDINSIISDFIETPGLEVVHDVNLGIFLDIWPKSISDYGDAIVAAVSKEIRGSIVATFDRRFRTALKMLGLNVLPL